MTDIEIDKTISEFESVGDHRYGWDTLFRDPKTRKFWELIYPPDGKPRELKPIKAHDARLRYSAAFSSKQSEVHDYWLRWEDPRECHVRGRLLATPLWQLNDFTSDKG